MTLIGVQDQALFAKCCFLLMKSCSLKIYKRLNAAEGHEDYKRNLLHMQKVKAMFIG